MSRVVLTEGDASVIAGDLPRLKAHATVAEAEAARLERLSPWMAKIRRNDAQHLRALIRAQT